MKKTLFTIIACLCAALCGAQGNEDGKGPTIRVRTAEDFLRALGSNRTVVLERSINLTNVFKSNSEWLFGEDRVWRDDETLTAHNLPTRGEAVLAERVFDGFQVVLANLRQLSIKGLPGTEIIVEPRYAEVLKLVNCHQIYIEGLALGHTATGDCSGGVLGFYGSGDIMVSDCDIYGCGYTGVIVYESNDVRIHDSNIRDCTGYITQIWKANTVEFFKCDIYRNWGGVKLEEDTERIFFTGCRFTQNAYWLFSGATTPLLMDCEIHQTESEEEPYDITDRIEQRRHRPNRITFDSNDIKPRRAEVVHSSKNK